MTDLEFRRRIIAAWGLDEDKFKDFDLGLVAVATAAPSGYPRKVAMSPYIPVVGGHTYTYDGGWDTTQASQNILAIALYNTNKVYVNYFGLTMNGSRTSTISSEYAYVRLTVNMDNLANAYILDNTTGEYVFRGSDYI